MTIRVLLIEDDLEDAKFIKDSCEEVQRVRMLVQHAATGKAGLAALNHQHFDVLLLDHKLPDMNGLEILEKVAQIHHDIPVVYVTNSDAAELQEEALAKGACDFLEKGRITSEVLQRACIYAIGVYEKKMRESSPAVGIGLSLDQLVRISRESIGTQTLMTKEISELRRELKDQNGTRKECFDTIIKTVEKSQNRVIKEVQNTVKSRWLFDWVSSHPKITTFFILATLTLTALLLLGDVSAVVDLVEALRK